MKITPASSNQGVMTQMTFIDLLFLPTSAQQSMYDIFIQTTETIISQHLLHHKERMSHLLTEICFIFPFFKMDKVLSCVR